MGEIENREETQIKGTKNILNKFIEENIPNLKVEVPIMVQKTCRTANRLKQR